MMNFRASLLLLSFAMTFAGGCQAIVNFDRSRIVQKTDSGVDAGRDTSVLTDTSVATDTGVSDSSSNDAANADAAASDAAASDASSPDAANDAS